MTDTTALRDLMGKVKAGFLLHDGTAFRAFGDNWVYVYDIMARDDTNAAIALCRSVLPGWDWVLTSDSAELYLKPNASVTFLNGGEPARALLICIIDAMIWEAEHA